MALVSSLYVYQVKGCKGIALQSATLTETGLAFDRHWMVIDADGCFVTQRELKHLALVSTALDAQALTLSAPGMAPLKVSFDALPAERIAVTMWRDSCWARSEDSTAARWFSDFLGQRLRLVRFDHSRRRQDLAKAGEARTVLTTFADDYPLLIVSEASLADLNRRLAKPLPMNRFRPNVVIAGVGSYDEDHLSLLNHARIRLRLTGPCTRCQVPGIDQDSAAVAEEPLKTLRTYRRHTSSGAVTFGQHAIIEHGVGERLCVGDSLDEEWNF
jgi:uncharacterized protein